MAPGFTHLLYPLDRPMSQKYLLAFLVGVLLSLPSIAQTSLNALPQSVKSHVLRDYADALEDVSVKNLFDVNSDGKDDFIVTVNSAIYCGSTGCLTQLLLSTKSDSYVVVYSGNLYELKLQPNKDQAPTRFDVTGHSSLCSRNGPAACEFVLELRGYELELIGEKR